MDAYWRLLADCIVGGAAYNPFLLASGALRLPDAKFFSQQAQAGKRTFRPLEKLGEGGYAFVYLVKELPGPEHHQVDADARYALKKVLASTPEHLRAAQREIEAQQAALHPCLLPLLDWSVVPPPPSDPAAPHTVYMLTPAYTDGSLADLLVRLGKARAANNPRQFGNGKAATEELVLQHPQLQQCLLSTKQVLGVFAQLCLALAALHGAGYAHRDVKTHNVLIRRLDASGLPVSGSGAGGGGSVPGSREGSAHGAARYLGRTPRAAALSASLLAHASTTNASHQQQQQQQQQQYQAPSPPSPQQQQQQQQQRQQQPAATAAALAGLATPTTPTTTTPTQGGSTATDATTPARITNAADSVRIPMPSFGGSPAADQHQGQGQAQQHPQRPQQCSQDGTLRGAERLRGVSPRTSLAGPSPPSASLSPTHHGGLNAVSPSAAEAEEKLRTAKLLDASDWAEAAFADIEGVVAVPSTPAPLPAAAQQQGQAQQGLGVVSPAGMARVATSVAGRAMANAGVGAGAASGSPMAGDAPSSPSLQVLVQAAVTGEEQHPDQATVLQLRVQSGYEAVLMDFGSARGRALHVPSRMEAMRLQEDAEANCTATFRAPELWDVPSTPCDLDQAAADVWAAGCTLFALMYGQSPFQLCLNQGGSLALAVMNVHVPWPKDATSCYPQEMHDLVMACLATDPAARPSAADLALRAQALMRRSPALPDPTLYVRNPPYPPEVH